MRNLNHSECKGLPYLFVRTHDGMKRDCCPINKLI
jgi:hypothetical protein